MEIKIRTPTDRLPMGMTLARLESMNYPIFPESPFSPKNFREKWDHFLTFHM